MFRFPACFILICSLVFGGLASAQERPAEKEPPRDEGTNSPEGVAFFEKKIRPVLVAECYECHSTEKGKKTRADPFGDLRYSRWDAIANVSKLCWVDGVGCS